jgi:PAS domain S-box-containing protein
MTFTLFSAIEFVSILTPNGLLGWLIWLLMLGVVAWLAWKQRESLAAWTRRDWTLLAGLAVLTPVLASILVVNVPANSALPDMGTNPELSIPLLASFPWMLAAAVLGSLPGAILAFFSGVLLTAGNMSSPFAPLEFAALAVLFGNLIRQGYRSQIFVFMRRPIIAAILLVAIYPLLYLPTSPFWAGESLATGFDIGLSRVAWVSLALFVQMIVGGIVIDILAAREMINIPKSKTGQSSPISLSLKTRFFGTLGPVVLLLFFVLAGVVWIVAGRAAKQLLSERMQNGSSVAASTVPFLLETGQNLILQLASDPGLLSANNNELSAYLEEHLGSVPYFEQYFLLGPGGDTLAGYPVANFEGMQVVEVERDAIERAFGGVNLQFFSIPPLDASSNAAQLSFVASVSDGDRVRAVLLGRSRLATNPFAQPILDNLNNLAESGGKGLLLDSNGLVVFQTEGSSLLAPYGGSAFEEFTLYEERDLGGAQQLVLYEPAIGSGWSVVSQLPLSLVQQVAMDIAFPVFALLLGLAFLAYLLLTRSLRTVTASLQDLIVKSERIAGGDLETALDIHHEDEIGSLGKSLERMRITLKARLEEIQRLLAVSQGISGSLEVQSQIEPILEAALASGASLARLVFHNEGNVGDGEQDVQGFGLGQGEGLYEALDTQVLTLISKQKKVLLKNPARARLNFDDLEVPQALAAFALRHKGEQLGALWLAYSKAQSFDDEEVGYLQTLADQAASSALNARLYLQAELGRQRLEALFETSPDPVFLMDPEGMILLANLSAQQLLNISSEVLQGEIAQDVIEHKELLQFLTSSGDEYSAAEINFGSGRIFSASLTEIGLESGWQGRVCLLRETTEARQTEAKRTEFLTTTSHELLGPLELVDGYLSMIDTVGELSDKQSEFLVKSKQNIAGMTNLVGSLLDLERIESSKGLRIESFTLSEVIAEAISEISPRAIQKSVKIEIGEPSESAPVMQADRTLLQRAIYNLLDNGVKNSSRGKQVEIKADFERGDVVISVKDDGAGFAAVDVPYVFDRVGDNEGRSGVGLSIVKSIIERHNGKVWAESELGAGSTFFAQLPTEQAS